MGDDRLHRGASDGETILDGEWYDEVAAEVRGEELRGRLAALTRCDLIDVMVVGERSWWAVLGGRSERAA